MPSNDFHDSPHNDLCHESPNCITPDMTNGNAGYYTPQQRMLHKKRSSHDLRDAFYQDAVTVLNLLLQEPPVTRDVPLKSES
ncbi:hypothetical protein PM082_011157 [Marasmius tenuissimus]|nr:hypothetical protein PM082_011157 [Marasmius tenuissimus]